jgi:pilus assembly protein CpaE
MRTVKIVAIGGPTFRQQVAIALDIAPEDIGYEPNLSAVEELLASTRADVLVLSPAIEAEDALELTVSVGSSFPSTAVVIVREFLPEGFLNKAMRAGVRDVVDLSQGTDELAEAIERTSRWAWNLKSSHGEDEPSEDGQGSIISVFSSKGGSGKTFIASNLAVALAERSGQDTAIIDLDIGMGDVFCYFGEDTTHPLHEMLALGHKGDRDDLLQMGTQLSDHLWGFGSPPDPSIDRISADSVARLLAAFRGVFQYIVVDVGVDYSDHALTAFDFSDTICLVTALDVVGIRHLSKGYETLLNIGIPRERLQIILNRADSKVGLDPEDVERVLGLHVDSLIPSSGLVPKSLNKGHPIYLSDPKSGVAKSIGDLADRFIEAPVLSSQRARPRPSKRMPFFKKMGGTDVSGRASVEKPAT